MLVEEDELKLKMARIVIDVLLTDKMMSNQLVITACQFFRKVGFSQVADPKLLDLFLFLSKLEGIGTARKTPDEKGVRSIVSKILHSFLRNDFVMRMTCIFNIHMTFFFFFFGRTQTAGSDKDISQDEERRKSDQVE